MRRTYAGLGFAVLLALGSTRVAQASCTASPTTLCLNDGRFSASVAWKDFKARTGAGTAVPITSDTGYFWFFSSSNIELVIKVLDARTVNGKFWVFFGALSNVEYTLTVKDTLTNATKTYVNPSGQFASVGDTKAFDPAGISTTSVRVEGTMASPASVQAVQRRIDAAQPATADFTPCPDSPHGFNLSGCRFHIEVDWTNGRGRSGLGQPVQLTNDTGYFWFFADTNVELMVKVLDARPVNGQYWVFFGALSNVQYSVTVTDTLTGTYRKYVNPSGTFASVGDTSAFRGGSSVTPAPDAADAASMDLDQIGGSVSARGADGTVFTLDIPPYALPAPTTVTLTPVSRVDRLPFSGGLVAGVEIGPAGMDLLLPATLTIQPASPPPPDQTLPFAYVSGGQDLILYPRDPDSASLNLPIARLGGFGVGQGPPADADAQLQRKPTGALAVYLQRYAGEVQHYEQGLIDRAQLTDSGIQIYRDAVADLGLPPVDASSARRAEGGLSTRCIFQDRWGHDYDVGLDVQSLLGIIRQRQMLGLEDDESTQALFDQIIDILKTCMQNAFNRCVANTDPYEALQMLQIAQQLSVFGVEDERLTSFVADSLLERCLRFEIDFESKIVEEATRSGGGASISSEENLTYRAATVPLRLDLDNFYAAPHGAHDGGCKLVPELTEFHYTAGTNCTVTVTNATNGFFNAAAAWIGILNPDPTRSEIVLLYDPAFTPPEITGSLKCPGAPAQDLDLTAFGSDYSHLHENEFSFYGLYVAKSWDLLRIGQGPSQNGEFFAKKSYARSIPFGQAPGSLTEETFFFLKHTPDKAMPPCN